MAVIQSNNNILRVGNGGSQYFAGDYINIDGNNTISVDYDLSGLSGKVDAHYTELQNVSAGLSGAVDYVSARTDLYSGHIDYVSAHVTALEDCCSSVQQDIATISGNVATNSANIAQNTQNIYNLTTATAALDAGKLDKTAYQAGGIEYNGVYPIDVNNDEHLISAKTAAFGVQEPLYFVQDDPTALVIGCSAGAGSTELYNATNTSTLNEVKSAISAKKCVQYQIATATGYNQPYATLYSNDPSEVRFVTYSPSDVNQHTYTNQTDSAYVYTLSNTGWSAKIYPVAPRIVAGAGLDYKYSADVLTLSNADRFVDYQIPGFSTLYYTATNEDIANSAIVRDISFGANTASTDAVLANAMVNLAWATTWVSGPASGVISSIDFQLMNSNGGGYTWMCMHDTSIPDNAVWHKDWNIYPENMLRSKWNKLRVKYNLYNLDDPLLPGSTFSMSICGFLKDLRQ